MTESEALESALKKIIAQEKSNWGYIENFDVDENWAVRTAIEHVKQYRQIGTVEELKAASKYLRLVKKHGTVGKTIEECAEYEEIGTVEECREAVEKQTAKRPEFVDTRFMNNGKHISDGCQLQKCYKCPNCNQHIFHVWDDELYCKYCGQHIDWSDEDGKID